MRCPLCVNAGARHYLLNDGAPPKNEYLVDEFWDEEDRFHMHDRQRRVQHLHCSNHHSFAITHLSRCPVLDCNWNKQKEVLGGVGWPEVPEAKDA